MLLQSHGKDAIFFSDFSPIENPSLASFERLTIPAFLKKSFLKGYRR